MIGATRYAILMIVASAFPVTLHAQIHEPYKEAMKDKGWLAPYESLHDRSWLNTLVFGDDTIWETDDDCTALKSGMGIFLSNAPMYYAQRPAEDMFAETLKVTLGDDYEFIVAFVDDDTRPGADWLADLLHEGWHWIHEETEEGTAAAAAENCARLRLEEDNEPTGNPVMPPEPVCEEKTRWVTKTKMVWVPKWEIEWRLEWDEVDEYGNVTHVKIGTRVDNGSWKEVTTLPELETYTECSN